MPRPSSSSPIIPSSTKTEIPPPSNPFSGGGFCWTRSVLSAMRARFSPGAPQEASRRSHELDSFKKNKYSKLSPHLTDWKPSKGERSVAGGLSFQTEARLENAKIGKNEWISIVKPEKRLLPSGHQQRNAPTCLGQRALTAAAIRFSRGNRERGGPGTAKGQMVAGAGLLAALRLLLVGLLPATAPLFRRARSNLQKPIFNPIILNCFQLPYF